MYEQAEGFCCEKNLYFWTRRFRVLDFFFFFAFSCTTDNLWTTPIKIILTRSEYRIKRERIITLYTAFLLLNFGGFTAGKRAPSFDPMPQVTWSYLQGQTLFYVGSSEDNSCLMLFWSAPLKSHWLCSYIFRSYFSLGVAGFSPWRLTALTVLKTSSSQARWWLTSTRILSLED
jgi:hypothetical protein